MKKLLFTLIFVLYATFTNAQTPPVANFQTNPCNAFDITVLDVSYSTGTNYTFVWSVRTLSGIGFNAINSLTGSIKNAPFSFRPITSPTISKYEVKLTVTDEFGSSSFTQIVVYQPYIFPSSTGIQITNFICDGGSADLSVNISDFNVNYTWYINNQSVSSGTLVSPSTITYHVNSLRQGDYIRIVAFNGCMPAELNTYVTNANPTTAASVSITPSATSICTGANVTFNASVVNGGYNTKNYQWKVNGNNVGTNSSTFNTTTLQHNDVVTVDVNTNNTCAAVQNISSSGVTMSVSSSATPSVSITTPTTTICTGANVLFTATSTNGGTTPTYQWKVNGNNIGTNTATFTSSSLQNNDVVTVDMTSNSACASTPNASSNAITMNVSASVTPTVSITTPTTTICNGANAVFTATSTNGGTTPSYQWKVNGNNAGTNTATFTSSSLQNNDVVTVDMTSNSACASTPNASSNAITMSVSASVTPTVSITTPTTTICTGANVVFTATSTNGGTTPTYQWKVNGNNAGTNTATFTSSSLQSNDVVTVDMTSNSACASTPNASSNAITMNVSASVTPTVSITTPTTTICTGANVVFTAIPFNGGTTPSYQWKVNGNNAGTNTATFTSSSLQNNDVVTVDMTSNSACASTPNASNNAITMNVSASVTPTVSISASATNITTGQSVTFTVNALNQGTSPAYQWYVNNQLVAGVTNASYTNSNFNQGDQVRVQLTSNAACALTTVVNSNVVSLTVNGITGGGGSTGGGTFNGNISGPMYIDASHNVVSYYVPYEPGVSYTWEVPTNVTIVSGQNTNIITVDFTNSTTGGDIILKETIISSNAQQTYTYKVVRVSVITSAMNSDMQLAFNLYPNPVNEVLYIQAPTILGKIEVMNAYGEVIYSTQVESASTTINVKQFSDKGLHLVRLYNTQNEVISTQKIVVE